MYYRRFNANRILIIYDVQKHRIMNVTSYRTYSEYVQTINGIELSKITVFCG